MRATTRDRTAARKKIWDATGTTLQVVLSLRDLGAHLVVRGALRAPTLTKRMDKANALGKRVKSQDNIPM